MPTRAARLAGLYEEKIAAMKGTIPRKDRSIYNCERYAFLLDSDIPISDRCCMVMKKKPSKQYAKETGRKPMTAQMASESRLRTQQWLRNGCNGFDMKSPISNPMSFWTEQDVLAYIYTKHIPIASVYGDVVIDDEEQLDGQMNIGDYLGYELFDKRPVLKTTGCKRTGCMFCGFGAHCKGDTRFVDLKTTHPAQYKYIMKPKEEGGLNYKEIIDWINEHGNMNILY